MRYGKQAIFSAILSLPAILLALELSASPTVILAAGGDDQCGSKPENQCHRFLRLEPASCPASATWVPNNVGNAQGDCHCVPPIGGDCVEEKKCRGSGAITIGATTSGYSARKGAQCANHPGSVTACSLVTWQLMDCGWEDTITCDADIYDDTCDQPGTKVCTAKVYYGCEPCAGTCPQR